MVVAHQLHIFKLKAYSSSSIPSIYPRLKEQSMQHLSVKKSIGLFFIILVVIWMWTIMKPLVVIRTPTASHAYYINTFFFLCPSSWILIFLCTFEFVRIHFQFASRFIFFVNDISIHEDFILWGLRDPSSDPFRLCITLENLCLRAQISSS